MTSSRFLIVNADDFGRAHGINDGIIAAHERGVVTSASLMVRWPEAKRAAAYARVHDDLSVGLHLDLGEWYRSGGRWVSRYEVVPMDDEPALAREIADQLRAFEDLVGRPPSHIDSHQRVHRTPPVQAIVRQAGAELGIPVRHFDPAVAHRGDFYGRGPQGEPRPDAIGVDALIELVRNLPPGITELCCHPGAGCDEDSEYGPERELELESLCDLRVWEAIEAEGVVLRSHQRSDGRVVGPAP